jgi:hypothetical protein
MLGLAAAPAPARSGRVGPQQATAWKPGGLAARLAAGAETWHGIYDAQPTGTIVYTMDASMTLTGTDATGKQVWSAGGGDVWAASGRLPAALVAVFPNGDPNVLRDGELRAYNANGRTRFRKPFKRKFVQPLADTSRRLVWVETSASAVTRIFVRQGSTTHTVALPYVPPRAHFPMLAAASADGSRVIVGIGMPRQDRRAVMTYWLRVTRDGSLRRVSHGVTDWVFASLTPHGDRAAILTSNGLGDGPNWWVRFGAFRGRYLPGNDAGMMYASAQRIFQQGAYSYGDGADGWGATTVEVFDRSLFAIYKRTWAFDDASSSVWFRHDGDITRIAGVGDGALTVINVDTWAITTLPGTYADAVPIDGGRLATMTEDGTLAFIADPVAGP